MPRPDAAVCFGQALPQEKGDEETSHARKETFDDDDFRGTFVADHFGAVVFKTPADAGTQHKKRTLIEGKGVHAFKTENDAGYGNHENRQPQFFGDHFFENHQSDDGSGLASTLFLSLQFHFLQINDSMGQVKSQ